MFPVRSILNFDTLWLLFGAKRTKCQGKLALSGYCTDQWGYGAFLGFDAWCTLSLHVTIKRKFHFPGWPCLWLCLMMNSNVLVSKKKKHLKSHYLEVFLEFKGLPQRTTHTHKTECKLFFRCPDLKDIIKKKKISSVFTLFVNNEMKISTSIQKNETNNFYYSKMCKYVCEPYYFYCTVGV